MRPTAHFRGLSPESGIADGEKILDVGCGTGSLTFALARAAEPGEIVAIDYSQVFADEAIRRNTHPRIKVQQADACALPFEGGTFEMRRVVRPGGVVAAAVWDHLGGMPGMRMIIDTVAALSESGRQLRSRYCSQPMMQPGEMKRTLSEQLVDVTEMRRCARAPQHRALPHTFRAALRLRQRPSRGPAEVSFPDSTAPLT
jgi:SAM-dependent methyltransferase